MLWGGRFKENLNSSALKFSSSLSFDINLLYEDLQVSKAHAEMLAHVNIISKDEAEKIIHGLNLIHIQFSEGAWKPDETKFEDIHSAIEAKLFELIGDAAGRLHTGRSRNDQVASDLRLWVKKSVNELINSLKNLQKIFLSIAEKHTETLIPGYTHLQRAQPVSFAFHLLAYVEMFERDIQRLKNNLAEADVSPLGSGALAGSTLPLDREFTAKKLGFSSVSVNALDSVSDRDFILDFLNCCSIGMIHLSRLSEEIIIWSSSEWSFVKLSDEYSTGSSLMPQKKNPDIAELIRGKSGRVLGNYLSLSSTIKGLPLSYNRDLQEDKEPLFDSFETYYHSLFLMGEMIRTLEVKTDRFFNELIGDFSLATDLADWLVLKGIPFREAHHLVGSIVKTLEEKNIKFDQISLEDLKKFHEIFDQSSLETMDIKNSLMRKKTSGSPNPAMVKAEIKRWNSKINS